MPYRTTRQGDQDIIDIYLWGCREFGQSQAERYHAGLAATLDLIAGNPRMARERTEFNPPVRLHPYQSHMISSPSLRGAEPRGAWGMQLRAAMG